MKSKPIIGITMGCPVSVGPEIIVKLFSNISFLNDVVTPIVIGDLGVIQNCCSLLNKDIHCFSWKPGQDIKQGTIPILECSSLPNSSLTWGKPNVETGKAMASYITTGVELVKKGFLDGITTCPIAKSTLNMAGFDFPGHTEMLAELTHCENDFGMMMAGDKLRVTLTTIHIAFNSIASSLTIENIKRTIKLTHRTLTNDFGIDHPTIAVAGLNPHASESGIFGDEEQKLIQPAIDQLLIENEIQIEGPFPPDTVFFKCISGEYDAVVCMYHDQGLIPFKLVHFHDGVNVTMGLPIVRTSVDHGTAYDIAGKGFADYTSLQQAVKLAGKIAENRKNTTF